VPPRTLRSVVAVLAVLGVVVGVYAGRPSPVNSSDSHLSSNTLDLPGLSRPVDVYRTAVGTPHVFAENNDDLFTAYGYVTAEDRLFQIDYMRRTAGGRLAEIRGVEFVANDRYFRTIGLRPLAEAVVAASDADTRRLLERFSAGVNAYIDAHRDNLPVEFKKLGYAPEPWTPVDSMLVWKTLGFALDVRRWQAEVSRAQIVARFGDAAQELFPSTDLSATILQPGEMTIGPAATSARASDVPDLGLLGNDALEGATTGSCRAGSR
jgi:penicillin amidase